MNAASPGLGNRLIAKQLARAATPDGGTDLAKFTALVAARYDEAEREQRRMSRAMSLMAEELAAANLGLQLQNQRFEAALENMSLGLAMYDADERLVVANARLCEVLSVSPGTIRIGMTFQEVVEACTAAAHFGDALPEEVYKARRRYFIPGSTYSFEERRGAHVVAITSRAMAGGGCVLTFEDRTERRQAEEQIEYMARHDALTGLPNRTQLRLQIDQALCGISRGECFAVFCLDLDRFKEVNDTLGHHVGDQLLRALTFRLKGVVRDADTVVRLGGDEFAIVQACVLKPSDATVLAARLVHEISQPYIIEEHQVVVGVSIGIALAPAHGSTTEVLMKRADMAMYDAKASGRGTWRVFKPEMDARMQERRQLEADLRHGMERNEFEVLFQPLINVGSQRITSFEALLRWNHPSRGTVSPADFIPLAEETGLIVPIGAWVLRRACEVAATWPDDVSIAVNVSAVQFRAPGLLEAVIDALTRSGLAGTRLEIEITESIVLQDNTTTLAILHQLRALGIRISMDDFGTGYSSLSYLRSFPFDKIKIDQSFVRGLGNSEDARAIVRAISGLGTSLGIRTTAEGVETREQFEELQADGCTEAQGYLFGRPMPPQAAAALIGTRLPLADLTEEVPAGRL